MRTSKWLFSSLALLVMLTSVALAIQAKTPTAASDKKIRIRFPDAPKVCGADISKYLTAYPEADREYVVKLFDEVYDEIVKVYGEPLIEHTDGVTLSIFYVSDSGSSMYFNHKGDLDGSIFGLILNLTLVGLATNPACGPEILGAIPDHTLFLSKRPGEDGFDHHFTHELIHVFHDSMDYLDWYAHSRIEEGMTEAAAELVAEQMFRAGKRDIRGSGLNGAPWDNLKHYDMWNYPLNGAWGGNYTGFSALHGPQFFWGGGTLFPTGYPDTNFVNPSVIPTDLRYAAAASLWIILCQALSVDPANPDFFQRFNRELFFADVTSASSPKFFKVLEKVADGAMVEGEDVKTWMLGQGLFKTKPPSGGLFIDVRNPEDFQKPSDNRVEINVYAIYPIDLNDPGDLLKGLNAAELPFRNCAVKLRIKDSSGRLWVKDAVLNEEAKGKYVFNAPVTDEFGNPMPLGGYVIEAMAIGCDKIKIGVGAEVGFAGTAVTYALRTGKRISGWDNRMLGATLNPARPGPLADTVYAVGASTKITIPPPNYMELVATRGNGFFVVNDHKQAGPFEAVIAQNLPAGSQHQRRLFQPYSFPRVTWVGNSDEFFVEAQPNEVSVEPGESTEATVLLIPNGVVRGGANGSACPLLLVDEAAIPGVQVELEDRFATRFLGVKAPDPTPVKMKIKASPDASPGQYNIKIFASGSSVGSCNGLIRNGTVQLFVLKPVKVSLNAVQVTSSGSSPLNQPITVRTGSEIVVVRTPGAIKPRQYSDINLEVASEITVAGKTLRFADWEFNNDPAQRISVNPLTQRVFDDLVITARYLSKEKVSLNVEATISGGTAAVRIPVPIRYGWGGGGPVLGAGGPSDPPAGSGGGTGTTPFEITPPRGVYVILEAPFYAKNDGRFYKFTKWETGSSATTQNKLSYDTTKGNATVFARYELTSPVFQGNFDAVNCQTISGWAWDKNQPNIPVNVDIYVDGKWVATITANQFRQDLLNAGIGNGYHGFSYAIPESFKDGKPHSLSVTYWGTVTDLGNSPRPFMISPAPVIIDEPDDAQACIGAPAKFAVLARGDGLRYEWSKGAQRLNVSDPILSFSSVTKADEGNYQVKVIDSCGRSVLSRTAKLTVGVGIAITTQPVNLTKCPGQQAVFTVDATGVNLLFQWRKNDANIPNATGKVYSIPSVSPSDAGAYHVVIYNGCDRVESSRVTLTVSPPPAISPASQLFRYPGGNGKFNVTGAGCTVTAVSDVSWITVTSGNTGTGNWTVGYLVAGNHGAERTGTITVGGAIHTVTQLPPNVVNDAGFVVQQVAPVTMKAGQRYTVMIKMRNLGTATWTTGAGYKLVSQSPPNNSTWGRSSVELPGGSAAPGAEVTFSFEITAPATPGTHIFQWRMAQNGVGFGDSTAALQLWVNR